MSPDAQRIAIAEACGWRVIENHGLAGGYKLYDPNDNRTEGMWCSREHALRAGSPDYTADLNAIHEAEKVLTSEQHQAFRNDLAGICGFNYNRPSESDPNHHRNYVSATAAQRCEAFLKAIGKWTSQKGTM